MRWALGQIQLSREETVDTQAVAITGARLAYMNALMMFADVPALAPAALFVRRRQLVLRMKRISQEVHMSPIRLAITAFALVGMLIGSTWGIVAAVPLHAAPAAGMPQTTSAQTVPTVPAAGLVGPMRHSLHEVNPAYPPEALASGVDAEVTVTLTVSPAGEVTDVGEPTWQLTIRSDSSIGDQQAYWAGKPWLSFVREAEKAAREWKFAPNATASSSKVSFRFRTRKTDERAAAPAGGISETARPTFGASSARPGQLPPAPQGNSPLRVGGAIKPPQKVLDVRPIYPEDAKAARVEGVVIIDVTIARDGTVTEAGIRRSIPLLDQAALDAVRQWRFVPTLMNGAPIDVLMTVTINFTLQ